MWACLEMTPSKITYLLNLNLTNELESVEVIYNLLIVMESTWQWSDQRASSKE